MIVLAIDPAMGCTGFAFLQTAHPDPLLLQAGTVSAEGEGWRRCCHLRDEIRDLVGSLKGSKPDLIVVETPFAEPKKVPREFQSKRSDLTLPVYGGAVGAAMIGAHDSGVPLVEVPVHEWARSAPSTMKDPYKTKRVAYAATVFNRRPEDFGCKTNAGNVADAALLGRWWLCRNQR